MIKNAWDLIQHVNQTINTYGKYNALLFASFLILFLTMEQHRKKERNNEQPVLFFLMASGVLILWNPVIVALFIKIAPYFANYWQLLWSVPIYFVIAQGAAVAYGRIGYQKKGILFGVILIALAGTILPYQSPNERMDNKYGIPGAEYEVFELIDAETAMDEVSLVGPNEIMKYARIYSASMNLPYGKDLWLTGIDGRAQTNNTYAPQVIELYQMMQAPFVQLEQVAQVAAQEGCTVVVLPQAQEAESDQVMDEYGYQYSGHTQQYRIFIRKG